MFTTLFLSVLLPSQPPTATILCYRLTEPMFGLHDAFPKAAPSLIRRREVRQHAAKELDGRFELNSQENWERFLGQHVILRPIGAFLLIQARELSPAEGALVVNAVAEGLRLWLLEYPQREIAGMEFIARECRLCVWTGEQILKDLRDELACKRTLLHDELTQKDIKKLEAAITQRIDSTEQARDRLHRAEVALEQRRRNPDVPIIRVRWAPGDVTPRPQP